MKVAVLDSAERGPVTSETIEGVHPVVAVALRAKSGMERLRLAHETWQVTRERLIAYLAYRPPEWSEQEVEHHAARRLLGDAGRPPSLPR